MSKQTPESNPQAVDNYIAQAAPFARPILAEIRKRFHRADKRLSERLKWDMPSFEHNGIVGGMAAFKAHVSWALWRGTELDDPDRVLQGRDASKMSAGKVTSVSELPDAKAMIALIRRAAALNDSVSEKSDKSSKPSASLKAPPDMPDDLRAALRKSKGALERFEALSPGYQREYIAWITEAKRPETRAKRIATTVAQAREGKSLHWKYQR